MVKILHRIFVLILIPCLPLESAFAELRLINSIHSPVNSHSCFDAEALSERLINFRHGTRRDFLAILSAGLVSLVAPKLGAQESESFEDRFLRVAGTVLTNIRDKNFGRLTQTDRDQLSDRLKGIINGKHFQIDPVAHDTVHWDEIHGIVLNPNKLTNINDQEFESIVVRECHHSIEFQRKRRMDGASFSDRFFSRMNAAENAPLNFGGHELQEDYKSAIALRVIEEFEAKRFELSYLADCTRDLSHFQNVVFDEDLIIREVLISHVARGIANRKILWLIASKQEKTLFDGLNPWRDGNVLLDWSMTWVKTLGRYRPEAPIQSKPPTAANFLPSHRGIPAVPIFRAAA
jgi:hypothetical protein